MAPKTTRSDWEFEVRRLRSQPLRIEDMLWTPEVRPLLSQPKNLSDLFEHFKTKGMLKGTIGTVDQLCERICTAVYLAQYDYIYARESQLWQRHLKKAASGVLKQQKRAFDV